MLRFSSYAILGQLIAIFNNEHNRDVEFIGDKQYLLHTPTPFIVMYLCKQFVTTGAFKFKEKGRSVDSYPLSYCLDFIYVKF